MSSSGVHLVPSLEVTLTVPRAEGTVSIAEIFLKYAAASELSGAAWRYLRWENVSLGNRVAYKAVRLTLLQANNRLTKCAAS